MVKESFQQVLYNAIIEKAIGSKVEGIKINEADNLSVPHKVSNDWPNAGAIGANIPSMFTYED